METTFSLSKMPFPQAQLLYQGLLCLVKSNSGIGFCNSGQGHPAYAIGREGKVDYATWGDCPEQNTLFQLMHSFSLILVDAEIDDSSEISDYVLSWSDFCHLAYGAYQEKRKC